ncbi:S53 family peptidase [Candidatus Gottesmanbacteria bacterium]|nr:S53 family peptidase [Candidatus Gottesmanbacteria bacterium]
MKKLWVGLCIFVLLSFCVQSAEAAYHFSEFRARLPLHIFKADTVPSGISPQIIKAVYHLPPRGGHGTIAIIGAYDDVTIENDLRVFSSTFRLPECTSRNGCLEKHLMAKKLQSKAGWNLETSLDVEWAHAIAPDAKILLVEARSPSGANLLKAVDYAVSRSDVVAVSMSWGGAEFPEEKSLDKHFVSKSGAVFFVSSGDNGWGPSWPASSINVVSVGGTTLLLNNDNSLSREEAWRGSGGGVSAYETQPVFQSSYSISKAHGMRAIPDVSYNADPRSGFSVYAKEKWYVLGGTSAGAPQWAAIRSLGLSAANDKFYSDKATSSHAAFFRDIISGSNGDCKYYCEARKRYDYVTGLGSPVTVNF